MVQDRSYIWTQFPFSGILKNGFVNPMPAELDHGREGVVCIVTRMRHVANKTKQIVQIKLNVWSNLKYNPMGSARA